VEIKIGNGGQVSIDESNHSLDNAEEEMFELELHNDTTRKPIEQDKVEEKVDEMADKVSITVRFGSKNVSRALAWIFRVFVSHYDALPIVLISWTH
jgi:hypothetical protein